VAAELEAIKEEEVYGIQVLSVIDSKECNDNKKRVDKDNSHLPAQCTKSCGRMSRSSFLDIERTPRNVAFEPPLSRLRACAFCTCMAYEKRCCPPNEIEANVLYYR
jgi:hypothetical protein